MSARAVNKISLQKSGNSTVNVLIIASAAIIVSYLGLQAYDHYQTNVNRQKALIMEQKLAFFAQGGNLIGQVQANVSQYKNCAANNKTQMKNADCSRFIFAIGQEIGQVPIYFSVDSSVNMYIKNFKARNAINTLSDYDLFNLQGLTDTLGDQLVTARKKLKPDLYGGSSDD